MLHTIDLYFAFETNDDFYYAFEKIKKFLQKTKKRYNVSGKKSKKYNIFRCNKSKSDKGNLYKAYKTFFFYRYGITVTLLSGFNKSIVLTLNCPLMAYEDGITKLCTSDDFETISTRFTKIMLFFNKYIFFEDMLPTSIDNWGVNRIDYAWDITVSNPKAYIDLLYKGSIPRGFEMKERYDSSYKISSKTHAINFYNKTQELEEKRSINLGEHRLRFEVQCFARKLYDIQKEYHLQDRKLSSFWNDTISREVVTGSIEKIIGCNGFYRYSKLLQKLRDIECKCREANIIQCIRLVKCLNEEELSMYEISSIMAENTTFKKRAEKLSEFIHSKKRRLTPKRLERYLKHSKDLIVRTAKYSFKRLKMNYLTLPDDYPEEYIDNPISLITEMK